MATDDTAYRAGTPVGTVLRRWPSLLAVALAGVSWGMDTVTAGQLLPLLPLVYVAAVVVRHRSLSWPLLALGSATFVALQAQSAVDPVLGFVVAAAGVAASGLACANRRELALQFAALVAWLALVLMARSSGPELATWLVAAGWAGHGLWDLWHLRREAVVSRSYAEWCGVFDVLVAAQLLAA
jgi:hypothetical protein